MQGGSGRSVTARMVSLIAGLVVLMLGTVAYASTGGGSKLWVARYSPSAKAYSFAHSIARSPDGSTVFVTGESTGKAGDFDYATVAYVASTGARLWVARYNGPGSGDDMAVSIASSPDGSAVFVTGASTGKAGGQDYATVAYGASSGAKLWVKRYNGPANGQDGASFVTTCPDGSKVFVTGQSQSASGQDIATVAYDASTGAQNWVKRYKGPVDGAGTGYSIAASPDGSTVFVAGESTGNGTGQDYAVVAYNASTGTQKWVARHDGPGNGNDRAISVAVSRDGSNVFVTGGVTGISGNMDYETVAYGASRGALRWVQSHPGPGVPFNPFGPTFGSVAASPDGSKVFLSCSSLGTTTGVDYATVAYDASSGAPLWDSRYNGPGNSDDTALSLAASPDGTKVFVTGTSNGKSGDGDYATVGYDASTGAQLWVGRYNGPANDWDAAQSVVVSPDGSNVFVTGAITVTGERQEYATLAYAA